MVLRDSGTESSKGSLNKHNSTLEFLLLLIDVFGRWFGLSFAARSSIHLLKYAVAAPTAISNSITTNNTTISIIPAI